MGTLDQQRQSQLQSFLSTFDALGFSTYRLCGLYRLKHGGGGPGLESPPERLVSTGPYAYTRNPMYLGHVIYLTGLTLTLRSWFGAALTVAVAFAFMLHPLILDC